MALSYNQEVGLRIFHARKNLKMPRKELGELVSLHETTIKRYEDGDIKALDIEKIKEFARALNVTPAYLMGWEDSIEGNSISRIPETLAAHFEGKEFTPEQLRKIGSFVDFVAQQGNDDD